MNLSRRNALKLGAGAAALWATGTKLLAAAGKKIPLGLQLYSVRMLAEKDLPGVLKQVGQMGFDAVEFAGYYGWDKKPQDLKKLLTDNNLKCCGTHTALETLQGDNYKKTVELHKLLGNKFLIVPWLDGPKFFGTVDRCRETAKMFNELAAKAKQDGMLVGYHAHAHDLHKVTGSEQTAWELFFDNTDKDVVMQLDTANCLDGGGDPVAILRKYPGRARTIHIKEHGGREAAPIGEGAVKWDQVFEICETTGGTEIYIVEHESGNQPMQSVKQCIDNLRKMGK